MSTVQLSEWMDELDRPSLGIAPLRITDVVPDTQVEGPVAAFADEARAFHARVSVSAAAATI